MCAILSMYRVKDNIELHLVTHISSCHSWHYSYFSDRNRLTSVRLFLIHKNTRNVMNNSELIFATRWSSLYYSMKSINFSIFFLIEYLFKELFTELKNIDSKKELFKFESQPLWKKWKNVTYQAICNRRPWHTSKVKSVIAQSKLKLRLRWGHP